MLYSNDLYPQRLHLNRAVIASLALCWFVSGVVWAAPAGQLATSAIPTTIQQLKRGPDVQRAQAAKALGGATAQWPAVAKALVGALNDAGIRVRWAAAGSLRRLGAKSVPALVAKASEAKAAVIWRLRAIRVLELLCQKAKAATPSMTALLRDQQTRIRRESVRWLSTCGVRSPGLAAALVGALGDRDWRVGLQASQGLKSLGQMAVKPLAAALLKPVLSLRAAKTLADLQAKGVPVLCGALRAKGWQARYAATYGLGAWKPKSIPCLGDIAKGLTSTSWQLRALSARILSKARTKKASHIASLSRCLSDKKWQVQRQAAYALLILGHHKATIVPPILAALEGRHPQAAREAAHALARLGPLAIKPLLQRLRHRQPQVRHAAIYALALFDHPCLLQAISALHKACKDPNQGVRIVALHALQRAAKHKDAKVKQAATNVLRQLPTHKRKAPPKRR